MQMFSQALSAARSALMSGALDGNFKAQQPILAKLVSGPSGPDAAHAASLNALRQGIATLAATKVSSMPRATAKALVSAAGAGHGLHERAATLKMLHHLYHEKNSGGQQIWVYSPPEVYDKWIFDEVQGLAPIGLENALAKSSDEVYSSHQRAVMVTAVAAARALALGVVAKLGAASDATCDVVRRYFGETSMNKAETLAIMARLAAGYQKIANACNAGNIVISDEPGDRLGGGWKDWAFVYTNEAMCVIYLQGAWLQKADQVSPSNLPPLWRCVRTIVHELSHKEVSTEDIVYGPRGLKPEGSAVLTPDYALHNADSWAYFAVDLMGHLTGPDKVNGTLATTAIRKTPSRALAV